MERNKYDREEKILISLPERFLEDVKVILEDEYEQFINSYNEKKTVQDQISFVQWIQKN